MIGISRRIDSCSDLLDFTILKNRTRQLMLSYFGNTQMDYKTKMIVSDTYLYNKRIDVLFDSLHQREFLRSNSVK